MASFSQPGAQDVSGKPVIVVGLGKSGISAASLLLSLGAQVTATDRASFATLPATLRDLQARGARLVLGGHDDVGFSEAALVVVSPGVPEFPQLLAAQAAGVPVIGETELAAQHLRVPICAVGGTNGKSTVTTLLGHMMESAELVSFVGGNLGEPACDAPLSDVQACVLEVSSFQMERLQTFRPKVAILLGITEDHLDRYPSFDDYAQAKGNCFQRQTAGDFAIVPASDELCQKQAGRGAGRLVTFGEGGDYRVERGGVLEVESGEWFDLSQSDLHGLHNLTNGAAAIAAGRAYGLSRDAIEEGLRRFRALPHRMALAGRVGGVAFYDDSKATNVGAAVTAIRGLTEERAVVILGGRDKLGSYDTLREALRAKGRAAILLGEAAERLEAALQGIVPQERARTMEGAVLRAFAQAKPGDAVLLSPACSSLDMYKNYAERGERFMQAVAGLSAGPQERPK